MDGLSEKSRAALARLDGLTHRTPQEHVEHAIQTYVYLAEQILINGKKVLIVDMDDDGNLAHDTGTDASGEPYTALIAESFTIGF